MKDFKSRFSNVPKKLAVAATAAVASVSSFAAADVTEVVSDIDGAKAPIAAVAGASLGAYVAIRVWKLVRRAI
jgi:uncharacterized membrane protein YfcA